ncbi:MAG: ribokinase [Azospira oryzae]|jgi:sugar/nucleoside kinase (ribokinase family)|nr:MAG: ribokinase [Azospira oryzae]
MYDLCCVGHITKDKVVTPKSIHHMAGGTSWYFSQALSQLHANYLLVTAVGASEMNYVQELERKGIAVQAVHSRHTVYFENRYGIDLNHRTQRVVQTADPFMAYHLRDVYSSYYHIGALLADDVPLEVIQLLASRGVVALDAQGYLRKVENEKVRAVDWKEKREALPLISILKVNDDELTTLTGCRKIADGARLLAAWGVKEVVITLGSQGSVIYCEGVFYPIPAFVPLQEADATGCGDTYMAGYLYQRSRGSFIQQAGEFAAAMASKKMEAAGPFYGSEEDVEYVINNAVRTTLEQRIVHQA